jgi:1-acyl-sn-glycerol-3-phosphate acyltransferase
MARLPALTRGPGLPVTAAPVPPLYRFCRTTARVVLERLFDLRVHGLEHVPARGPYIVAANHHNYLDGVVLGVAVPPPMAFLVMPRVWRASPLHPAFHRWMGSIRLTLGRNDVGALRQALDALRAGRVLGIFPEGPFSVRGRLEAGLPGVGLLALRSGVPVVPAGIQGTYQALVGRRFHLPRPHPVRVRFGPARRFDAQAAPSRDSRRQATERIMADIATLLS